MGEAELGGHGPSWIRWIVCLRTASVEWNVPGKYGPHVELFSFLIQKEPASMPGSETHAPDLGDEWRLGCPKSPIWESEGEAWSDYESVSSSECATKHCMSLGCVGLVTRSLSLSLFLNDWELAKVALSCHMALDMLCQEMHEAW